MTLTIGNVCGMINKMKVVDNLVCERLQVLCDNI